MTSTMTSHEKSSPSPRHHWSTRRTAVVMVASIVLFQATFDPVTTTTGNDDPRTPIGRVTSSSSAASTLGLQCPTCDRIHCAPRRPGKLRCRGGIARGICDCCPVCAKTEGEGCGGQWNYLGRCDVDLVCEPEVEGNDVINALDDDDDSRKGVCRKRSVAQSDQPRIEERCRPRCTAEYCRAHPKAVCSANDSAERKQSCQAECQHTSCGACAYVRPEMECVRCRKDDFDCIRKFGRCVRRTNCNRTKQQPCGGGGGGGGEEDEKRLKFQCLVPSCLSP